VVKEGAESVLDPMGKTQQLALRGLKRGGRSSQRVLWALEQMRWPLEFVAQVQPPVVLVAALPWLLPEDTRPGTPQEEYASSSSQTIRL